MGPVLAEWARRRRRAPRVLAVVRGREWLGQAPTGCSAASPRPRPDGSVRCRHMRPQAGLACGGLASEHAAWGGDSCARDGARVAASSRGNRKKQSRILGIQRRRGTGGKNHGRMVDDFSYYRSWVPESLSASIRFVGAQSPDVAVGLVEKEFFPFVYAQGDL